MSTRILNRRLERLKLADAGHPVVVESELGESLAMVRRRARAEHGELDGRVLVVIEREVSKDES